MALIVQSAHPLAERAALMWHDHFATSHDKVGDVRLMHRQAKLFRKQGLGDFRELLHSVAKDPAMLVWLDGDRNRKGQPNENFAREVMELFALGIGNYDERDVQEAARAFTGWGTAGRAFEYREEHHDDGVKVILTERGRFGGDEALDLILAHPACPRFVARRVLEELVMPAPPEHVVAETAALLVANDWHVGRTMRVLLASELFFSPEARRARIAGPVELVAATSRALGTGVAPVRLAAAAAEMGQALCRPPSVKGWDGGRVWIDAGKWVARHNTLADLARSHVEEVDGVEVDLSASLHSPADVVLHLLPDLSGGPLQAALADAARAANSTDEALAVCAALALTSPEYQLY
jgi:uncharacterized protein (DUF1800 family)